MEDEENAGSIVSDTTIDSDMTTLTPKLVKGLRSLGGTFSNVTSYRDGNRPCQKAEENMSPVIPITQPSSASMDPLIEENEAELSGCESTSQMSEVLIPLVTTGQMVRQPQQVQSSRKLESDLELTEAGRDAITDTETQESQSLLPQIGPAMNTFSRVPSKGLTIPTQQQEMLQKPHPVLYSREPTHVSEVPFSQRVIAQTSSQSQQEEIPLSQLSGVMAPDISDRMERTDKLSSRLNNLVATLKTAPPKQVKVVERTVLQSISRIQDILNNKLKTPLSKTNQNLAVLAKLIETTGQSLSKVVDHQRKKHTIETAASSSTTSTQTRGQTAPQQVQQKKEVYNLLKRQKHLLDTLKTHQRSASNHTLSALSLSSQVQYKKNSITATANEFVRASTRNDRYVNIHVGIDTPINMLTFENSKIETLAPAMKTRKPYLHESEELVINLDIENRKRTNDKCVLAEKNNNPSVKATLLDTATSHSRYFAGATTTVADKTTNVAAPDAFSTAADSTDAAVNAAAATIATAKAFSTAAVSTDVPADVTNDAATTGDAETFTAVTSATTASADAAVGTSKATASYNATNTNTDDTTDTRSPDAEINTSEDIDVGEITVIPDTQDLFTSSDAQPTPHASGNVELNVETTDEEIQRFDQPMTIRTECKTSDNKHEQGDVSIDIINKYTKDNRYQNRQKPKFRMTNETYRLENPDDDPKSVKANKRYADVTDVTVRAKILKVSETVGKFGEMEDNMTDKDKQQETVSYSEQSWLKMLNSSDQGGLKESAKNVSKQTEDKTKGKLGQEGSVLESVDKSRNNTANLKADKVLLATCKTPPSQHTKNVATKIGSLGTESRNETCLTVEMIDSEFRASVPCADLVSKMGTNKPQETTKTLNVSALGNSSGSVIVQNNTSDKTNSLELSSESFLVDCTGRKKVSFTSPPQRQMIEEDWGNVSPTATSMSSDVFVVETKELQKRMIQRLSQSQKNARDEGKDNELGDEMGRDMVREQVAVVNQCRAEDLFRESFSGDQGFGSSRQDKSSISQQMGSTISEVGFVSASNYNLREISYTNKPFASYRPLVSSMNHIKEGNSSGQKTFVQGNLNMNKTVTARPHPNMSGSSKDNVQDIVKINKHLLSVNPPVTVGLNRQTTQSSVSKNSLGTTRPHVQKPVTTNAAKQLENNLDRNFVDLTSANSSSNTRTGQKGVNEVDTVSLAIDSVVRKARMMTDTEPTSGQQQPESQYGFVPPHSDALTELKIPETKTLPSLLELIHRGIVQPGKNVFSVFLQNGPYVASLTPNGKVQTATGLLFPTVSRWLMSLTGAPQMKKSRSYRLVHYKGKTLISLIENSVTSMSIATESHGRLLMLDKATQVDQDECVRFNHTLPPTSADTGVTSAQMESQEDCWSHLKTILTGCKIRLLDERDLVPGDDLPDHFWDKDLASQSLPVEIWAALTNW